MSAKVGTFTKSVAGAPAVQTITDVGFLPQALILWTSGVLTLETPTDGYKYAIGLSSADDSGSVANASQDNQDTSVACKRHAAKALTIVNWDQALLAECDVVFTANGFELTWTTNDDQAYQIHYAAIRGDYIENVKLMQVHIAQTSLTAITPGFRMHGMLGITDWSSTATDVTEANAELSIGVYQSRSGTTYGSAHSISSYVSNNQATSKAKNHSGSSNRMFERFTPSNGYFGNEYLSPSVSSVTETGTYITHVNGSSDLYAYFLIFKGAYWLIASKNPSGTAAYTINADAYSPTMPYITPELAFFLHALQDSGSTAQADGKLSFGAVDAAGNQAVANFWDDDAAATTNTKSTSRTTQVVAFPATNGASEVAASHWHAFGQDTVTLHTTSSGYTGLKMLFFQDVVTPTTAPVATATVLSDTSARVSWAAVPGAETYYVERGSNASQTYVVVGNTTGLSLDDTGLTKATPYVYRVRALRETVYSYYSSPVARVTTTGRDPWRKTNTGYDYKPHAAVADANGMIYIVSAVDDYYASSYYIALIYGSGETWNLAYKYIGHGSAYDIFASIDLDSNGDPHIAYVVWNGSGATIIEYLTYIDGVWTQEDTGYTAGNGGYDYCIQLRMSPTDVPHIVCYGDVDSTMDLRHIWKVGTWQFDTIEHGTGATEYGLKSLGVDFDTAGGLYVCYWMKRADGYLLRYGLAEAESIITVPLVASNAGFYRDCNLVMDSSSHPHIVNTRRDASTYIVKYYQHYNGVTWTEECIEAGASGVGGGGPVGIALLPDGTIKVHAYEYRGPLWFESWAAFYRDPVSGVWSTGDFEAPISNVRGAYDYVVLVRNKQGRFPIAYHYNSPVWRLYVAERFGDVYVHGVVDAEQPAVTGNIYVYEVVEV